MERVRLRAANANLDFSWLRRASPDLFPFGFKSDLSFILRSAVPLLVCNICQVMFPMVSMFYCGHIGTSELNALSLANTLINVVAQTSIIGLLTACDTMFPQIYGGPNKKILGLYVQKALAISMLSCLPIIGILLNARFLISLVVQDPKIPVLADQFIVLFTPAVVLIYVQNILIKYLQSQNIVNPIMVLNTLGLISNIALHELLVRHFFLGIKGAAVAINVAYALNVLMILAYVYATKLYTRTWNGWTGESLLDWRPYLALAIPGLVSLLIQLSNFEVGTFTAGLLDKVELGALAISQQIIYLSFQLPLSIATAGSIRIGQLLGSDSPFHAFNSKNVLLSISATVCVFTGLIIYAVSDWIPVLFTNDRLIANKAALLIKICALVHLVDAIQGTLALILRSTGAQLFSSIATFIAYYLVGTPIGVFLLLGTTLKSVGFFFGDLIGCVLLIICQLVYINGIDWSQQARKAYDLSRETETRIAKTISFEKVAPVPESAVSTVSTRAEVEPKKIEDLTFKELLREAPFRMALLRRLAALAALVVIFSGFVVLRFSSEASFISRISQNQTNLTSPA